MKLLLVNVAQLCSAIVSVLLVATPLAALTININDLTPTPVVTLDSPNSMIEIVTELGLVRVRIFAPLSTILLLERGFFNRAWCRLRWPRLTLASDEMCLCTPGLDGSNGSLVESDPAEQTTGERRVNCSISGFICIFVWTQFRYCDKHRFRY